jgi:AcrR family transcriptional regulator
MALNRERVLAAAIELADTSGVDALSMRSLGAALGVEAMSLYNHVANKEDVLSGMNDIVWASVDLADSDASWRSAIRRIAVSTHDAFLLHPWSGRLHGTRVGPARLGYIDATLRHLRLGGFSPSQMFHAHHMLDGYILGYTLQMIDYSAGDKGASEAVVELIDSVAAEMPDFIAHVEQHTSEDVPGLGFEIGLDLMLDGLERSL